MILFQSRYLSIVYLTGLVAVDKPANLCIVYRLKNINMFPFGIHTNRHMECIFILFQEITKLVYLQIVVVIKTNDATSLNKINHIGWVGPTSSFDTLITLLEVISFRNVFVNICRIYTLYGPCFQVSDL